MSSVQTGYIAMAFVLLAVMLIGLLLICVRLREIVEILSRPPRQLHTHWHITASSAGEPVRVEGDEHVAV